MFVSYRDFQFFSHNKRCAVFSCESNSLFYFTFQCLIHYMYNPESLCCFLSLLLLTLKSFAYMHFCFGCTKFKLQILFPQTLSYITQERQTLTLAVFISALKVHLLPSKPCRSTSVVWCNEVYWFQWELWWHSSGLHTSLLRLPAPFVFCVFAPEINDDEIQGKSRRAVPDLSESPADGLTCVNASPPPDGRADLQTPL